jgi:hypothetical protein
LAEVVSIETRAPVKSGDGRVVVGTLTHMALDVFDVRLVGSRNAGGCIPLSGVG